MLPPGASLEGVAAREDMNIRELRPLHVFCILGAIASGACSSEESAQDSGVPPADSGTTNGGEDSGPAATPDGGMAAADSGAGSVDAGPLDTTCDPAFGQADACGGDPVGTWTYVAGCADVVDAFDDLQQACPGAQITPTARTTGGTLTFLAAGTFTRSVQDTVAADFVIPPQCVIGGCGTIETVIETGGGQATCTASGGGCNCTASVVVNTNDSGSYATANGQITATPNGGQAGAYHYCVEGSVLRYHGVPGNPHADNASYVLTK